MLDEDLSWLLGAAATGALPSRPRAVPRRAARRRRARRRRLSGERRDREGDHRARRRGRRARRARVSCRDRHARRQLVTAGGRVLTVVGRGATHRDAIDVAYRAASHVRSTACSSAATSAGRRSRRESSTVAKSRVHEVRRRHVRLPGQPGRLAGDRGRAARAGRASARRPSEADLVVVNTCSVTASADQGARQTIRRIARDNPGVRVVVTGCYATRRPDELRALPNVDARRSATPTRTTSSICAMPDCRPRALRRRRRPVRRTR